MSTESLRNLVEFSIKNVKFVKIEVQSGTNREVMFKEFIVEGRNAVGTTDDQATTVVVIFPRKEFEAIRRPFVVLGH